jgi:zinc protease
MDDPGALGIALSEAIAKGDWRLFLISRDRVESTTVADVQRVALTYFLPSNRTTGLFIPGEKPQRAQIPPAPDVAALVAGYQGKPAMAAVPDFDRSPANIEASTRRLTLGNGMQLALLPKPTRGGVVNGVLTLRMGDIASLQGQESVGELTASMLLRGAGTLDRQQISDRIAALQASVQIGGSAERVTVRFETRREHLADLLDLLRTVLRAPTFPAQEFETLRTASVTTTEGRQRQPGAMAGNALGRHGNPYPPGDPRYTPTFTESVAALQATTPARLRDFHARFYGTSHAQLALVGDFDADSASTQLNALFGDWTATAPFTRVDRPFVAIAPAALTLRTPGKANAVYLALQPVDLTDDSPDYALLRIADRVFGGNGMRSRLADRLRQQEGLSYGAGSWLQVGALDHAGRFGIQAQYAPQNLGRVQQAVSEELGRFVRDGITETELAEARSGLLQQRELERADDGALAATLAGQLYLGRTMGDSVALDQRLRAATRDGVNTAIRQYLVPGDLAQAFAGDFTDTPAQASGSAGEDASARP